MARLVNILRMNHHGVILTFSLLSFLKLVTVMPSNQSALLPSSTRVELYSIAPRKTFFAASSVKVVLLRLLVLPCNSQSFLSSLASTLFNDLRLSYDTKHGAPSFTISSLGASFKLEKFLASIVSHSTVNCYDMAALGQIGMSFMTANTDWTWCYERPFGYINATKLIGVPGDCNNPFFSSNGSPQVIDINDSERTGFSNHAFVVASGDLIFDACSGPQAATLSLEDYLKKAIDHTTELTAYATGTLTDAGRYLGIRTLTGVAPTKVLLDEAPDAEKTRVLGLMDTAANASNTALIAFSNADLRSIADKGSQHFANATIQVGPVVTIEGASAEIHWVLETRKNDDWEQQILITAQVHKNKEDAARAMTVGLYGYQLDVSEILGPHDIGEELGHRSLASKEDDDLVLWTQGNIFVTVQVRNNPAIFISSTGSAKVLAKAINALLLSNGVEEDQWESPSISNVVGVPAGPVKVGTVFTLQFSVSQTKTVRRCSANADCIIDLKRRIPYCYRNDRGEFGFSVFQARFLP
jgi:hypothetical protein